MDRTSRALVVVLIACALAACHSTRPTPIPGSSTVAAWQEQFAALDCWNPRHGYDMASTEPVVFAMASVCRSVPFQKSRRRWQALVTIDARTNEVRAIPVTSIWTGGVHYTASGDVVWYSSSRLNDDFQAGNLATAFTLRKGELKGQQIGHVEVPFDLGPGIAFFKGEGCHLVAFHNHLENDETPRLSQYFLVKDDEPFASAKPLEGVGRGLFWDPLRRHFIVQRQPPRHSGPWARDPLDRYAVDCSGVTGAMDAELARRLEPIKDENATYKMSRKGDLLVGARKEGSDAEVIMVFYGDRASDVKPPELDMPCPDLGCEPFYEFIRPREWSASGDYFMIDVGFHRVDVYRAADMQIVKQWNLHDSHDFPAHGFINDHLAYELGDHSRMIFQTW